MHYVLFALICGVWGSNFILMKKATVGFSPAAVGWGRLLGGAAFLIVVCWWRRTSLRMSVRDALLLAGLSLLGYGWPYAIQPWLVQRHGSGFIGLSVAFVPLLTILVSIPLLNTYPSARQLFGVLGALVCMGGLVWDGMEREVPLVDLALAFSVPFAYAITNTMIRKSLKHLAAIPISAMLLGVPVIALTPLALGTAGPLRDGDTSLLFPTLAILILGVFGTGWGTVMFNSLIQSHGPLFASMVTYLVPLGALAWGWVDHEQITGLQILSLCGVLAMVAIVQTGVASQVK